MTIKPDNHLGLEWGDKCIVNGVERTFLCMDLGGWVVMQETLTSGPIAFSPSAVTRPPLTIPEGWELMSNHDLKRGVHEVNDGCGGSWQNSYFQDIVNSPEHLVIARKRADT